MPRLSIDFPSRRTYNFNQTMSEIDYGKRMRENFGPVLSEVLSATPNGAAIQKSAEFGELLKDPTNPKKKQDFLKFTRDSKLLDGITSESMENLTSEVLSYTPFGAAAKKGAEVAGYRSDLEKAVDSKDRSDPNKRSQNSLKDAAAAASKNLLDPNKRSRYGLSDYQKQVDAFNNSGTEMVTFMGDELKEVTLPKKEYEEKYKGRAVRKRPKILDTKILQGELPQVEYEAGPETEEVPDPTTWGREKSPFAAVSLLKKLPRPTVSTDPASSVGASSRAAAKDRGERGRLGPVGPQGGAKAFLDLVGGKSPEVDSTFENPLTKGASPKGVPEMIQRPEGQRLPELPEAEIDLGEADLVDEIKPDSIKGFDDDEGVNNSFNSKANYDDFFKRAATNATLGTTAKGGLGATSTLYAPHRGLRLAKRMRKAGFGAAAERMAYDWAKSPEGSAPAVANQAMRNRLAESAEQAEKMRRSNDETQKLLREQARRRLMAEIAKNSGENSDPKTYEQPVRYQPVIPERMLLGGSAKMVDRGAANSSKLSI